MIVISLLYIHTYIQAGGVQLLRGEELLSQHENGRDFMDDASCSQVLHPAQTGTEGFVAKTEYALIFLNNIDCIYMCMYVCMYTMMKTHCLSPENCSVIAFEDLHIRSAGRVPAVFLVIGCGQ